MFGWMYNVYLYVCLTQNLVVSVRSRKPSSEVLLVQELVETSDILTPRQLPGWKLHNYLVIQEGTTTDTYTANDKKQALLSVTCKASRRPSLLMLNVFVGMVCVCLLLRCH